MPAQSDLRGRHFNADATYKFELKTSNATADKVVAKDVTINSDALFSFIGLAAARCRLAQSLR
ncbi:MAG: hypothetical protein ABJB32_01075 [Verrucomicrobiota bacterium]